MSRRDPTVALRDMLDHAGEIQTLVTGRSNGYDAVNFDILWQIITAALPPLVVSLDKVLRPRAAD